MNIKKLKEKYVGKLINSIVTFKVNETNKKLIDKITGSNWEDINSISIILFDTKETLAFVDYDCDGYRSGNWYLIDIQNLLDKGNTEGIKKINSIFRDIEYIESDIDDGTQSVIITTDEYLISMGQNYVHDYYPNNFFNIEEAKGVIKGDVVKIKEEKKEKELKT